MFWRDVHSVTGIWISSLALFLLLTGLPWAKSWGTYFKAARQLTGTAVARQDWSSGREPGHVGSGDGESSAHSGHNHGGGSGPRRSGRKTPKDLTAVDRIVATVRPLALPFPVVIAPPERGSSHWTAKSMTPNRPQRVNLVVDGATGDIVSRQDSRDLHLVDRVVAVGIAAHEGRLFGWPNQALGLLTAIGLDLMCVSGLILWWRRRDQGVLGAPKVTLSPAHFVRPDHSHCAVWNLPAAVRRVSARRVIGGKARFESDPAPPRLAGAPRLWDQRRNLKAEFVEGIEMLLRSRIMALVMVAAALAGCGVRPVTGGTKGVLRCAGKLLSDIQVTVYQVDGSSTQPIGFGVTTNDGSFRLVKNNASGCSGSPQENIVAHSNRPARRFGLRKNTLEQTPRR